MVHTWDTVLAVVKVVDHKTGQEHFLDPEVPQWKDTSLYLLQKFSKMVNYSVTVKHVLIWSLC